MSRRTAFRQTDFNKEMLNKGIRCELRVIADPRVNSLIHNRFIISKYNCYNIPSPDIIARGQLSEISKSTNRDDLAKEFQVLWGNSKDIIQDWNNIKNELK